MIFSGLVILENNNIQNNMKQVQYVKHISPELSNFTFNYTPKAGQYWDVDFNGQVKVSSGDQISFKAPAGNYSFSVLTPQGQYSGNAIIRLSGVPWWYTVGSSALAGASVGFIAGGPLGALIGGIAGGIIGGLIAYFFGASSPQAAQDIRLIETEQGNTMSSVLNQIMEGISLESAISSLTETSYYYFSQEMEAVAERYLNSSFNESQLLISSGVLNQMAHIFQPILDIIGYSYVQLYNFELDSSAGPSSSFCRYYGFNTGSQLSGVPLDSGQYYWLDGNNTYFYEKNVSITWKNVFTGKDAYVNSSIRPDVTYEGYPEASHANYAGGSQYMAGYVKSNLTGLYQLVADYGGQTLPGNVISSAFTDALPLGTNWNGAIDSEITYNLNCMYEGYYYNSGYGACEPTNLTELNPTTTNGYHRQAPPPSGSIAGTAVLEYNYSETQINSIFTTANDAFSNAYKSASTFITELEALGYTNYSQIPANETIPFPSWFVPASILNGTFNQTQLYAIYVAYLDSLNNTFHNEKRLTGNDSINQTIFGGFAQETGILNLSNNYSGHKEINGTFLIEINQGKLKFQVGQETTFKAQTPVIVISGSYGDPTWINGSLIQAGANSTFYTTAIIVNGTSEQSYTLSGQLIKVYLYSPKNLTGFPLSGFFLSKSFAEYLVIAILVIVILAAVIVGMAKKGGKSKKKRAN